MYNGRVALLGDGKWGVFHHSPAGHGLLKDVRLLTGCLNDYSRP